MSIVKQSTFAARTTTTTTGTEDGRQPAHNLYAWVGGELVFTKRCGTSLLLSALGLYILLYRTASQTVITQITPLLISL